jgi:hypothetical protein
MASSVSGVTDLTPLYEAASQTPSSTPSTSTSSSTDSSDAQEEVQSLEQTGSLQAFLSSSIGAAVLAQSMDSSSTPTLDTLTNLQDHLIQQALAAYQVKG